jgi:hypothetical protein
LERESAYLSSLSSGKAKWFVDVSELISNLVKKPSMGFTMDEKPGVEGSMAT